MKNQNKLHWEKPICESVNKDTVTDTVLVSACSDYESCFISINYMDSVPGKPPVEII